MKVVKRKPLAFYAIGSFGLLLNPCSGLAQQPEPTVPASNQAATKVAATPVAEPSFNIWEYEIRGTHLLATSDIEMALLPFLGPNQSIDTVEKAADALQAKYRDSGFPAVVVNIPEQDVNDGRVILTVTEGVISRVRVSESRYFLLSDIKARTPSLKVGEPLYVPQLQKELNQLNSLSADLRVLPVLKAGQNQGEVEIELKVKDKLPLHGGVEINNYASAATSASRLKLSLGYDNLWHRYHGLSLQHQSSPENPDEVSVTSGTYILPLQKGASRLALYAVESNSKVATNNVEVNQVGDKTITALNVAGDSQIAGLRYVKPVIHSAGFEHVVNLGLDYKRIAELVASETETETSDSDSSEVSAPSLVDKKTALLLWSGQYTATWRNENTVDQLGFSGHFGLRDLVNEEADFAEKRYQSHANFSYLKANYKHQHKIRLGLKLKTTLGFQWAQRPIIANEQFTIGGVSTVRGYYESQSLGDRGLLGSIELQSPTLLKNLDAVKDFHFLWFYDMASVETIDPLPEQINSSDLASTGLGLRFLGWKGLSLDIDVGYALTDSCAEFCGDDNGDVEKADTQVHAKISFDF